MNDLSHFIAYTVFGILTTIVNIVSYHVSYTILLIPNVLSTILAWTLAVIFAFITNKLWVFDSPSFDQRTLRHEIHTFLGARVSTGILDVLIMYVAVNIMTLPSLFWKCISNVIVIVLNYVASKLIIFTKTGDKIMKHFFYPSLHDDAGAYYPGFFVITLNQQFDGSINPANFTEEQFATFAHEYTHYLQDISTTRGIYTFTHFSQLLQLNFHIIATMPDNVVQLPLKPEELKIDELNLEESYIEDLQREIELYKFYEGSELYGKRIHHVNCIKREPEDCFEYVTEEMYNINIYYDDGDIPFVLGQIAIAESMAYTVESEVFNPKKRTKEFPYNACEMICKKECPQLLASKAVFVAAMELSLMHYHSGDMFWHLVTDIRDNNLYFNSVSEFEEYFNKRTYFLYEDMLKTYKEAMECIDFLYPDSNPIAKELFRNARNFEQDKLRRGTCSRINNVHTGNLFIAKMLESENPRQLFIKYINYFGLPVTCDSTYGMYGTKIDGDITALLAPLALYDMFEGNSNECSLYPYCKASNMAQCNKDECNRHPWTQADKTETCILGAYWHMYSLTGKSIIRKA